MVPKKISLVLPEAPRNLCLETASEHNFVTRQIAIMGGFQKKFLLEGEKQHKNQT